MFRRYGHGHSVGLGVLLTLALERHALLAVVLVFAAGVVAGRAWSTWQRLGAAARRMHAERMVELRSRVRYRRRAAAEQAREVKRAYIDGAIDGGRQ